MSEIYSRGDVRNEATITAYHRICRGRFASLKMVLSCASGFRQIRGSPLRQSPALAMGEHGPIRMSFARCWKAKCRCCISASRRWRLGVATRAVAAVANRGDNQSYVVCKWARGSHPRAWMASHLLPSTVFFATPSPRRRRRPRRCTMVNGKRPSDSRREGHFQVRTRSLTARHPSASSADGP
jgi:hypothetical protein